MWSGRTNRKYLVALKILTASKDPPVRHLRDRAQAVAYLMVGTSGNGFGYLLWIEGMI